MVAFNSAKLRMKFISALVIQQTMVILVQDHFRQSFKKAVQLKGISAQKGYFVMRPVVKLTRGCGCFIILLLIAGLVLCIMQKTTLGLYISFTGLILQVPYVVWGFLLAYSDTIEKQKENANNNADDESATMAVIAAHQISERLRK